jgi:sRNA-binding regulator protein Hfq
MPAKLSPDRPPRPNGISSRPSLQRPRLALEGARGRAYSQAFSPTPLVTRPLKDNRESPTAESFFLHKQMTAQTPLVIVLDDDERIEGVLEWYDHNSIKLRCKRGVRVMVYKPAIKYLYKAQEK